MQITGLLELVNVIAINERCIWPLPFFGAQLDYYYKFATIFLLFMLLYVIICYFFT